MITISRFEKFSTGLLALKKEILTLNFSTWRGQVCFKDSKIPLFVLLPQNIIMPTTNLRLVLVFLSQFKVLWDGHRSSKGNTSLGYDHKFQIEVELISGKKFNQTFTVNKRQVAIVPCKYEHLLTYISTYLVWW